MSVTRHGARSGVDGRAKTEVVCAALEELMTLESCRAAVVCVAWWMGSDKQPRFRSGSYDGERGSRILREWARGLKTPPGCTRACRALLHALGSCSMVDEKPGRFAASRARTRQGTKSGCTGDAWQKGR